MSTRFLRCLFFLHISFVHNNNFIIPLLYQAYEALSYREKTSFSICLRTVTGRPGGALLIKKDFHGNIELPFCVISYSLIILFVCL